MKKFITVLIMLLIGLAIIFVPFLFGKLSILINLLGREPSNDIFKIWTEGAIILIFTVTVIALLGVVIYFVYGGVYEAVNNIIDNKSEKSVKSKKQEIDIRLDKYYEILDKEIKTAIKRDEI